jgi:replication factor C subunit 1
MLLARARTDLNTLAKDDEKEQGGAAKKPPKEQGARKHPPKEQRSTANKSPAKTQVATDASDAAGPGKEGALASKRDCKTEELKKKDETTANKTPQGKLTSPPNSTPPTKKDASKVESGEKSTAAAKAKVEEQAEEAPKKKFNPWNHEKAEVPNKHLRDQKIAENRGKENCLDKLTFVITGILDSMEREECADLIKSYGGKVTGGVSGKTAYLIVGSDPGESKLKKATEKGVKTIDEDGLFAIIKKSGPPSDAAGSGSGAGSAKKLVHDAGAGEGAKKIAQQGGGAPTPVSNTPQSRGKEAAETTPQGTGQAGRGHAEDAALWMRRVCADAASLWVDKYKPKGAEDLMGNGDKREQLRSWLAKWGTASASSGAKAGGSGGGWGVGGKVSVIHKAVLMHGPPGIGKTSSARVVIESLGYTMIELNASDVRNKSGLQDKVASLTQNQSISTLIKGQKKLLQTFSGPKGGSCKFCGKNERQHFKGAAQNCFSTFIKVSAQFFYQTAALSPHSSCATTSSPWITSSPWMICLLARALVTHH